MAGELKRRTTDETIRKKVRDNYVGFTETELSMNLRDIGNFWERQELNPGPLGEKRKCYLCAMQSLCPRVV